MLAGLMWLGSISLSAQEGNHAVRERVHFRFSRSAVDSTYRGNASSISRLDAAAAADGLQYVQVRVSSSPDGPEAVNARLARERASSVKAWLKERYPQIPDSLVRTIIVPEDWDGVARYISRTAEPWKAEALTIISGNKADREARLKDLWVGEAWENLMKHSFPLLRRAEIQFVFGTSAPQDVEGQVLPEERPSVASPSGDVLFAVGKTALVRDFAANAAAIDRQQRAESACSLGNNDDDTRRSGDLHDDDPLWPDRTFRPCSSGTPNQVPPLSLRFAPVSYR